MNDALAQLLAPYQAALAGDEMNTADPIYQLLNPPATTRERMEDAGAGPAPEGDIQAYARKMAREMFGKGQWGALNQLVSHESSWDPQADNPTSTAYGLFQFLDSTRENYGLGKNASPYEQIDAGLRYVKDEYKNPVGAWNFWQQNRWY